MLPYNLNHIGAALRFYFLIYTICFKCHSNTTESCLPVLIHKELNFYVYFLTGESYLSCTIILYLTPLKETQINVRFSLHLGFLSIRPFRSLFQEELSCLRKEVRSFCRVCQTCLSLNQTEIRDQVRALLQ